MAGCYIFYSYLVKILVNTSAQLLLHQPQRFEHPVVDGFHHNRHLLYIFTQNTNISTRKKG